MGELVVEKASVAFRRDVVRALLSGLTIALGLIVVLYSLSKMLPEFQVTPAILFVAVVEDVISSQDGQVKLLKKFPTTDIATLIKQRELILSYAKTSPVVIAAIVCLVYVAMQTFAIPGTLSLSMMCGALYGTLPGLFTVSVVCTCGATSCYLLSKLVGKSIALKIWPGKIQEFAKEVDKRRGDMLSYIIFLRVTPILPNTFINVVSPIVGVPLAPFVTGTFFGCMPNNLIAVNAGNRLTELSSFADLYDVRNILLGLGIGVAALASIYWKRGSKKVHTQ